MWLVSLAAACSEPTGFAGVEAEGATLIVLDSAREAPLAGVRVTAPDGSVVETDATGACRLLGGRWHGRSLVHLEKPGYGHEVASLAWAPEMEAYLGPLLELRGRVRAEDGAPVAGAQLMVERVQCASCAPATAVSDLEGRYELVAGGIDLQLGKVTVAAPGFARNTVAPQPSFGVVPREHDFVLRRGLELTGRVVDFETGAGLSGADVDGIPADESGNFTARVLPTQGFVELAVRADGRCRLWARIPSAEVERREPLRFPLVRGTTLEGTVRDAEGRPVTGVEVSVYGPALDPGARDYADPERPEALRDLPASWRFELDSDATPDPVRTDDAGRFRFEGLPPWSRLALSAYDGRSRFAELELAAAGGPGESTRTELTLAEVRARDEIDIAIAVRVNGFGGDLPGVFSWKGRTREGRVASKAGFQTRVEGGELALRVELDDFPGPLAGDELTLTHLGGFHPYVIDVRVPAKPIAGRVRFEDGPAMRVKVRASSSPPRSTRWLTAEVRTDAEGRFRFDAPDLGAPYEVSVLLGEAGRTVEVEPGTEELDVALRRPGAILVRATDPALADLLPSGRVALWWKLSGEAQLHRVGAFELLRRTDHGSSWLRVPNGELEIEAWPQSEELCPSRGRRVHVSAEGEPTRVEFALVRGTELTLRFDEAGGPPPGGHAWLLLEQPARDAVREHHSDGCGVSLPYEFVWTQPFVCRQVRFDSAGSAVVRGLTPGPHCLRAFPDDLAIEPETIQVGETPSEPAVVRWRRAR